MTPTYGSAPTPPVRKQGAPFASPFKWQDEPFKPHQPELEVHPALPGIRLANKGSMDSDRWQDPIVIAQGEPVGVHVDTASGRKFIVPATGGVAAKVTYSQMDVDAEIEDLDNLGNPVEEVGQSTATLPVVAPIGVANQDIMRNFSYTVSDAPYLPGVYQNYDPDLKPVVAARGTAIIPWYRFGPKAIVDAKPGKYVVAAAINNVSTSSRPFYQTANIVGTGAGDATAATLDVTVAAGNGVAAGETLTITVLGTTYTFTATADPVAADGEFDSEAADNNATATSLEAAIDAVIPDSVATAAIAGGTPNVVNVTSSVLGDEGNFTADTSGATDISHTANDATDADASIQLSHDLNERDFANVLGKIWSLSPNLGYYGDTPALSHSVTNPGMDLSGKETGGVPQEFLVKGNSSKGYEKPADWSEAGALTIYFF